MLTCLRAADGSILRTDVSGLFGGKISFLRLSARYGYAALTPPMENSRIADGVPGPTSGLISYHVHCLRSGTWC